MDLKKARRQYNAHKGQARQRGIGWGFTFDEWCRLWLESGVYDKRGRRRDEFVMCRPGDTGPYAVGNVQIRTSQSNIREGRFLINRKRGNHQILNEVNEPDEELEYWEEWGNYLS